MGMGAALRRWTLSTLGSRNRPFDLRDLSRRHRFANEAVIRSLCRCVSLGDGRLVARVLGRYKMFLDADDVGLSTHLALDGYWEMWLTEALAEVVRPGMTVVDIGANLGYFTLLMAELVGPVGHVHAFEPNPRLTRALGRSLTVNGFAARVTLHEQALSDDDRPMRLVVPDNEPKNGWLQPPLPDDAGTIRTCRFDALPALADAQVVKIDADTSEEAIWHGMAGFLAAGRPLTIFLEFAGARYSDPAAFLDEIERHGFSVALLTLRDGIVAADRRALLDAPADEDQMLVLRRSAVPS